MALLKISEPEIDHSALASQTVAIGIDLGTTNSLVAIVENDQPKVLPDEQGNYLLPSVVYYRHQEIMVGAEAKSNASKDSLNTIVSVKRMMGRDVSEIKRLGTEYEYHFVNQQGMPVIQLGSGRVTPVEVSAEILKKLKCRAEKYLNAPVLDAVITVPAYFDEAQRQATKDAARLAGLHVLRLLNEPTAAAIAYGLDQSFAQNDNNHHQKEVIAVYDLGGGTFDISILQWHQGVFKVLAVGGDSALGGDDIDHGIAQWIIQELQLSAGEVSAQSRELLQAACEIKEKLSTQDSVEYKKLFLTKEKFNLLIQDLIQKTIEVSKQAIKDARVEVHQIQQVVMVGGSTRIPYVRKKVAELFNTELLVNVDPDQVVALGAAIQANALIGRKTKDNFLLLDVIPLSLGLETMGGLVEKIILRNTTIPVAKAAEFTTFKDNQTGMIIHVLQGERELVTECRSLARFELKGIPPMPAGAARIQVSFQIDTDGLLHVSALEKKTGIEASIEVKPSYGLTDREVETMLTEAQQHIKEDLAFRRLREAQLDAERMKDATVQAIAEDADLLSAEEKSLIEDKLNILSMLQMTNETAAILKIIKELEATTQVFAQKRMDRKIQLALQNKVIG